MRDRDVSRLKDLLGPVGKKLRMEDPAAAGAIWRRWSQIVGDDIARNAEPTSLKEGVLRIRTSSATWATEMSYLANDIKARVNDAVGKPVVREVRVWTSPAPIERARRGADHTRSGAPPVRKKAPADDPESAFQRAFQAWSKRRAKGRS
jgi:predicted nucleic acid-binding Zn ribbon protein